MRLASVLAIALLWAAPLVSQMRDQRGRPIPQVRINSMEELRSASEFLARRLEIDAFVSTRLAAAVGDLEDFQTNAAIAKAQERIREAQVRVSQTREADSRIGAILAEAREVLLQAERSSAVMGMADVQKDLRRQSGRVQRILYDDLDAAQKLRKSMSDMQKSLNLMAEGLDAALEEALGAMFSYLRSGGA